MHQNVFVGQDLPASGRKLTELPHTYPQLEWGGTGKKKE